MKYVYITGLFLGLMTLIILSGCSAKDLDIPRGCTQDAKICPDGTAVGRTGPNCEFSACPAFTGTAEMQCKDFGGIFISGANECERISKEQCTQMNGTFNECASACRNDPTAEFCTMQCVQVCKIG